MNLCNIELVSTIHSNLNVYKTRGVVNAHSVDLFSYENDAFIPIDAWNLESTCYQLANGGSFHMGNSIFVGKLHQDIINLTKTFNLDKGKVRNEIFDLFKEKPSEFVAFCNEIETFISSDLFIGSTNVEFHRLVVSPPGLKTLNYKIIDDCKIFTGLHIDRSEIKKLGEYHLSRQRLCINMGETRYLYYCPTTVDVLQQQFILKTMNLVEFDNILSLYYRFYKKKPVYAVEIPFGHYYIAPTDNLIHDGSSKNHKNFDVTLHYLGNFKINKQYEVYKLL